MKNNCLITIAGDSGAGKSTLLNFLYNLFNGNATCIEGDAYHKWERNDAHWKKFTPLNPKANNLKKCEDDLIKLKNNEAIYIREYNHNTGLFDEEKKIIPKDKIIFAGLHALCTEKLRQLSDIKIFLNTDEDLQKLWKYNRDINERGYTHESAILSIKNRVIDSNKYIKNQLYYADIIIDIFDENLELNNKYYEPNITTSIYIKKSTKHLREIQHLLKNISEKEIEDETFIKYKFLK